MTRHDPEKRRRLLRVVVQGIILLILLAGLGTVGFIEYAARPSFCKNCHNMQPYYDSWTTSTHQDVPCIKCHYAPGIKAEAMGKIAPQRDLARHRHRRPTQPREAGLALEHRRVVGRATVFVFNRQVIGKEPLGEGLPTSIDRLDPLRARRGPARS